MSPRPRRAIDARRYVRIAIGWLALVVLAAPARAVAAPVVLRDGFDSVSLGRSLELAYDPSGRQTAAEIVAGALPFAASTVDVPSFGYRLGGEWARFSIDDQRTTPSSLVLEDAQEPADRVELYRVRDGEAEFLGVAGCRVPREEWPLRASAPAFLLTPRRGDTFYVHLVSDNSHQLPLVLLTGEAYAAKSQRHYVFQSLYLGALVVMALYSALLGVLMRSRPYVVFTAYLIAYGVFQAAFVGVLYLPFRASFGVLETFTIPAAIALVLGLSLLFASALLDLPKYRPVLARRLMLLAALATASPFIAMVGGYRASLLTAMVWFGPVGLGLVYAGLVEWRAGSHVARTYLAARLALVVGTSVNISRQFGWLPTNAWTSNAQQAGSLVEFVLLSLALAGRIRDLYGDVAHHAQVAKELADLALSEQVRANQEQERVNTELRHLDAMKDEFLANTSHELRTPLHGILGLSEAVLASDGQLAPSSRERLGLVIASGRRLSSLVDDILDFSKLRHHGLVLREKNVPLADAVALAMTMVGPLAAPKGLHLSSDIARDLVVRADENRLQQVLTNLLGNAVKFTASGSVTVGAAVRDERVVVSVRDTGIGISPEAQGRIFESFEQADGSTGRTFGGTGLGLAVTKKLVELHGGQLVVASTPGAGSVFSFDLAMADRLAPPEESQASSVEAGLGWAR